jgi:hypothetical protein
MIKLCLYSDKLIELIKRIDIYKKECDVFIGIYWKKCLENEKIVDLIYQKNHKQSIIRNRKDRIVVNLLEEQVQ